MSISSSWLGGMGSLISLFPPPYGVASGNTAATTAPTSGCYLILPQSSGTMKNPSGITTMKSKYAKPQPGATLRQPFKQETEQWSIDPTWLCSVSTIIPGAHGRPFSTHSSRASPISIYTLQHWRNWKEVCIICHRRCRGHVPGTGLYC